jgi:prevent-host-death family protein
MRCQGARELLRHASRRPSLEYTSTAPYVRHEQSEEAALGAYSLAQAQEQLARLVDEALTGEVVTITLDGKPVVTLAPTVSEWQPEPEPLTDEFLEAFRKRRALRPSLGGDSVTLVREMREEER